MSFSTALTHLKLNGHITRKGWNGKGMYLYRYDFTDLDGPNFEPCIVMVTAQGKHQPGWLASQADMLAEDWILL